MALLLNPRVLIAIALAALLASTHLFAYRSGRAAVRTQFDAYKIEQATLLAAANQAQRDEEARRQSAIDKEAADAAAHIATLETDLRGARAAADGLRAAATNAASRACKGAAPAAPGKAQPGGDPIRVLADVLGRADERAGILAEHADRLRAAGIACERSYDALTPSNIQ